MVEPIEYRENPKILPEDLSLLFKSAGMRRPVDDLRRLQKMIENASLTIGAFVGPKLVGIARSMTDFSYCCYLSDLAVHADFQRRGIGDELIRRTLAKIGPQCSLVLVSAPGAMSYYPARGFELMDNGWIIKRKV